jgi:hypothetical protein
MRYILSAFLPFCLSAMISAQTVVPKRDMQPVDSLNQTTTGTAPATVIKKGYAHLSGEDGRYYHREIIPYLVDTLRLDTIIAGGSVGDEVFYDFGTTDTPVAADDSVETTNVKYILFNGLSGGLNTKIEMLKEGTIRQSIEGGGTGDYIIASKIMPIQSGQNNTSWNVVRTSFDNTGIDKNNETINMGFNLTGGGLLETDNIGETGFGFSFESNYRFDGTDYNEWHLFLVDTNNVPYRPITFYLNKYNPALWTGAFHVPEFELRPPDDTDPYFEFRLLNTQEPQLKMVSPVTGKGATFYADPVNNYFQIINQGMTTPELYLNTWYNIYTSRITMAQEGANPAVEIVGREAGTDMLTVMDAAFGVNINASGDLEADTSHVATQHDLLGVTSHAFHEVGTSSPPNAISDHIFKSSGSVAIGQSGAAAQTLHVQGTARITGSDGSAEYLMARDSDGDISSVGPGPGLQIIDNELQLIPGGADSSYTYSDTICFIDMGDTLCVPWDSTYIDADAGEICYWVTPDTTCIPFSGDNVNVYNSNGTLPASTHRYFEIPQGSSLYFRKSNGGGAPFSYVRVGNPTSGQMLDIEGYTIAQSTPIIRLANGHTSGNILMHYNGAGTGEDYAMGVDKGANAFRIAEGEGINGITGFPMLSFHAEGDSVVANKDFKFWAGLRDHDGDLGTSGQVLTSTGTTVDWDDPSGGGGAISDLTVATSANDIDNVAYQQDWRWNSLAGGSGLKLSSNSTAATGNTQKLFDVRLSGANASANQITIAGYFQNLHTNGTGTRNYGLYGETSTSVNNSIGVYGVGSIGVYGDGGSAGTGVYAETESVIGIQAIATSGIATRTNSTSGTALEVGATTGLPMDVYDVTASTNTVERMALYTHGTSGTAAAGLGQSHDYHIEASDGDTYASNSLISKWTTATAGSRTSQFIIQGVNSTTTQDILTLAGSGLLTLPQYTTSNHNGGTAADSVLVVTSAGVVKKRNAAAFGGSSGGQAYDKGITVDGAGSVLTSGIKGRTSIPVSGTITNVTLLADAAGTVVFDIKKSNFAGFPGSLTSIVGANDPELSSSQSAQITIDGGWTTSVTAGDVIEFSITGTPLVLTECTLILTITP